MELLWALALALLAMLVLRQRHFNSLKAIFWPDALGWGCLASGMHLALLGYMPGLVAADGLGGLGRWCSARHRMQRNTHRRDHRPPPSVRLRVATPSIWQTQALVGSPRWHAQVTAFAGVLAIWRNWACCPAHVSAGNLIKMASVACHWKT